MAKSLKRTIKKMFREFLVYHHSSLEYRAKILTLMVSSDGVIDECEKQVLKEIAYDIYIDDVERSELLLDTIYEYHNKIITNNGLNFEHLIQLVIRETRDVKRFAQKIDIELLKRLQACVDEDNEEDMLFKLRIVEFLENLKSEYSKI